MENPQVVRALFWVAFGDPQEPSGFLDLRTTFGRKWGTKNKRTQTWWAAAGFRPALTGVGLFRHRTGVVNR